MRKILVICLSIGFIFYSCKSKKAVEETKRQSYVNVPKMDSVISITFDTLLKADGYDFGYRPDPNKVAFFKPYYINDICCPGNYNHPLYKRFMQKGTSVKDGVLASFIESLKTNSFYYQREKKIIERKLGNIEKLKQCKLVQLPVYYLSPNVVEYVNGTNIKKYYQLDTNGITYRVLKDDKLITILNYRQGGYGIWQIYANDSLSYDQLKQLNEEPLAFINNIKIPLPTNFMYDKVGYLQADHIVFSDCAEGEYNIVNYGDNSTKQQFQRTFKTILAEVYFATKSVPRILDGIVGSSYQSALYQLKIKKNK
ncbi:hypothetical protein I5M32_11390 [Pedobacter sp. SD-b]|uniref:DKNYY family protein n=1 Tax=Pedobacter segetis TaxID=2793069 RepID=A0ABS1BMM8_9SPHI|nr:hypothetical protein [Pedobacter segetis]MBK0383561.1 hypothetical protein [Pedobacter segetis]